MGWDASLKEAYGTYAVPADLIKLIRMEEELHRCGTSLAAIACKPVSTFEAAPAAPPDWIPFAETGGDGIQFGFLSEFGQAPGLDQAPVVCITPTNDPPVRLMARNLREFLQLAASVPYVELLESWWSAADGRHPGAEAPDWADSGPPEIWRQREDVWSRFRETFGSEPIPVLEYLRDVRAERQRLMAIPTLDGLGVVRVQGSGDSESRESFRRYMLDVFQPLDEAERERIDEYLETVVLEEKLALIRDVHFRYRMDMEEDDDLGEWFRALLVSLGLEQEKRRSFEL